MPVIIALVIMAFIAITIFGIALHLLFTPWVLVIIALLAWIKFGPRRSRQ